MSEEVKVVGFKLPQNIIMDMLNHLQASGTTLAGENVNLVDDCIIWVLRDYIVSITADEGRKLIMQAKINKLEFKDLQILNKGKIPINIGETKKFLGRFSSNDAVEFIYENGMISLKRADPELEIFMATKRIESIRHDFFNNLRKQITNEGLEKDKNIMKFFKANKSIYSRDDEVANVFGVELDNSIEVACGQLKEVVKDGELLENRIYPFTIVGGDLSITAKSMKDEDPGKITRKIYMKKSNFTSEFSTSYSSQFNAAVSSTRGHVLLYFGENKPLLLIKQSNLDHGIDMSYLVMPYLHKK